MHSDSWQLFSIALLVMSAVVQIAGIVTPLWIWLENGDKYLGRALFYRIGLDPNEYSSTGEMSSLLVKSEEKFNSLRRIVIGVLETTSVILVILLIPAIIYHYRLVKANANGHLTCVRRLLWIFAALSWTLNAAGLVTFIIYNGEMLTEGQKFSHENFSWSGVMCFFALLMTAAVHFIIITRFDDALLALPSGADPKINQFPSKQAHLMGPLYQYDAHSTHNRAAAASIDGLNPEDMMSIEPNNNILDQEYINRDFINGNHRALPMITRDAPERSSMMNNGEVSGNGFGIHGMNYKESGFNYLKAPQINNGFLQNDGHQQSTLFDNSGYSIYLPRSRGQEFTGRAVTTRLERTVSNEPYLRREEQDITDQEYVNVFHKNIGSDQMRHQLVHETDFVRKMTRPDGDFFVTAKHGTERDPHRQEAHYMSHTKGQGNGDEDRLQRLVLSPVNFTQGNVNTNPSFIYRPYSEQVY